MTQEEKQLLIKDLCARVPHRTFVCLNPGAYNKPETCILTGVHGEKIHLNVDSDPFRIDHIKPYLRPMSSMTEEERGELCKLCDFKHSDDGDYFSHYGVEIISEYCCNGKKIPESFINYSVIDFFLEHHLDWRGLIPMGLALEAPEDMYKEN